MNKKTLSLLLPLPLLSYTFLACLLLSSSTSLFAEEAIVDDTEEGELKAKPDNDEVNPLDNVDIRIIKRADKTLTTYSTNGIVYKVKVSPKNAPAYYFYDMDGDGSFETRSAHEIDNITVQQWKIFEW